MKSNLCVAAAAVAATVRHGDHPGSRLKENSCKRLTLDENWKRKFLFGLNCYGPMTGTLAGFNFVKTVGATRWVRVRGLIARTARENGKRSIGVGYRKLYGTEAGGWYCFWIYLSCTILLIIYSFIIELVVLALYFFLIKIFTNRFSIIFLKKLSWSNLGNFIVLLKTSLLTLLYWM